MARHFLILKIKKNRKVSTTCYITDEATRYHCRKNKLYTYYATSLCLSVYSKEFEEMHPTSPAHIRPLQK